MKKVIRYKIAVSSALVLFLYLGIRLYRLSEGAGEDFTVYWKAVQFWVSGVSPYRVVPADQGYVFKYPPWILPFLTPLYLFNLTTAIRVGVVAQIFAIIFVVRWVYRNGTSISVAGGVALSFWWIWLGHAYSGQITVFILASCLWGIGNSTHSQTEKTLNVSCAKLVLVFYALSVKIFSIVTCVGIWRRLLRRNVLGVGLVSFVSLQLILLIPYRCGSLENAWATLVELYRSWLSAASSGGAELGSNIVRGHNNHGLTAAILRAFHIGAERSDLDIWIASGLAIFLAIIWMRASRKLTPFESWSGWISLGLIVHPLAWYHSFVMAYPLCAFSLQSAISSRRKSLIFLSALGISAIALFIPQVIGVKVVVPLEELSSKSWGVIFCSFSLVLSKKYVRTDTSSRFNVFKLKL